MKGIESSKQLFNQPQVSNNSSMPNREENKISGMVSSYDHQNSNLPPNGKNPSYYSRGPNTNAPLSPASQKDSGGVIGQSSRNMSVLNIKKSSARFLNPINGVADLAPKQLPHTNIDKYPNKPLEPASQLSMPAPRSGIREAKNQ